MHIFFHGILNWLELVALTFSLGALTGLLVFIPAAAAKNGEKLRSRVWLFFTISVAALWPLCIADLMMRSAEMGGDPLSDVFPALPTVVFHSHFGTVWLIRIAALALISILLLLGRRNRGSRGLAAFLVLCTAVVSMTASATGHAADKGDFSVAEIVDWLHLVAASVWGGGLFVLALLVLPGLETEEERAHGLIALAASRFSLIAGMAVPVIVLTAIYSATVYVGSFDALVRSPYGWTMAAKAVLLCCLIVLGAFNRYVGLPRMRKRSGLPELPKGLGGLIVPLFTFFQRRPDGRDVFVRFRRSLRLEACLMIVVLFFAGMLRHEIPAKHYLHSLGEHHQHPHH